jgi:hypothetical protein
MEQMKRPAKYTALGCLLPAAVIAVFLALSLIIPLLGARESANRARCLSNLKQVALALKQYALDNDKVFPWDPSESDGYYRFVGKLHSQYARDLTVFVCPSSHDKVMSLEDGSDADRLFSEDQCRTGLSYAYGHDQGNPWTEAAPQSARLLADKYATEDYSANPFPSGRWPNHWRGKTRGVFIGRNAASSDGSARWDNEKGPLEADPETEFENSGDMGNDQTGLDWWSDPPGK